VNFVHRKLEDWKGLAQYQGHGWLYRGHRCLSWNLETSIERYFKREKVVEKARTERSINREFSAPSTISLLIVPVIPPKWSGSP
jgi:hypothetical protein